MGRRSTRKKGVAIETTIITCATEKPVERNPLSECGMALSSTSTSFEKRFRMRPAGVVSKNDMGARNMRSARENHSLYLCY